MKLVFSGGGRQELSKLIKGGSGLWRKYMKYMQKKKKKEHGG